MAYLYCGDRNPIIFPEGLAGPLHVAVCVCSPICSVHTQVCTCQPLTTVRSQHITWSNVFCLMFLAYHMCAGDSSGPEEGDTVAVQVSCQVLPGGRPRRTDPGGHTEALLPSGK